MKDSEQPKRRRFIAFAIMAAMVLCSFGTMTDTSYGASHIKINGVDIGYAAGQYFSKNGKACKCHNQNKCVPEKKGQCNCKHVSGCAQCYGFALWCQNKLFGYNDVSKPSKFKSIGSVKAGKLTSAQTLKKLISSAPIGSHIRTYGNAHSMILMSKTSKGFTVAQANGSNNREFRSWSACRIGTATYTWNSYIKSTYGKRGIRFINIPKNYTAPKTTPAVKSAPSVKSNQKSYTVGQSAKISWNKVTNATKYTLNITGPGGFKISNRSVSGGGSYTIKNLKHGKYTASVKASNSNSSKTGSCSFVVNYAVSNPYPKGTPTVSNGEYHIVSALDETKNLDVSNHSKNNGANIQLWASSTDAGQTFHVTYLNNGYYKITSRNSGKSLDVKSGGAKSGTNVQQWGYAGTNNQQWVIKDAGDGSFYIVSKSCGLYLDVAGGKTAKGTNIQVYKGNGSKAQKWKFVAYGGTTGKTVNNGTYHIVTALDSSKNLDVKSVSKNNGANIQLWGTQHDPRQRFQVTYLGNGYYKLTNTNSGKCLDVKSRGVTSGTKVQQWTYGAAANQQWIIRSAGNGYYYIIAKNSGLYLDVTGGIAKNGTNIQVYIGNGTNSQKWKFVKK